MTEKMMHYCEGTWREGFVLDCKHAEEHKVKLVQTDANYKAMLVRLGGKGKDE